MRVFVCVMCIHFGTGRNGQHSRWAWWDGGRFNLRFECGYAWDARNGGCWVEEFIWAGGIAAGTAAEYDRWDAAAAAVAAAAVAAAAAATGAFVHTFVLVYVLI